MSRRRTDLEVTLPPERCSGSDGAVGYTPASGHFPAFTPGDCTVCRCGKIVGTYSDGPNVRIEEHFHDC